MHVSVLTYFSLIVLSFVDSLLKSVWLSQWVVGGSLLSITKKYILHYPCPPRVVTISYILLLYLSQYCDKQSLFWISTPIVIASLYIAISKGAKYLRHYHWWIKTADNAIFMIKLRVLFNCKIYVTKEVMPIILEQNWLCSYF